jgi:hypothetical protein
MTNSESSFGVILLLKALLLLVVPALIGFVSAYSPTTTTTSTTTRRNFFTKTLATVTTAATTAAVVTTVVTPFDEAHAIDGVISSKYCAYGQGGDCEDLAEGNTYIQELQRKSAANKDVNVRDAENAFYAKNYPGWFETVGKTMIRKESDGTFIIVDDVELAKLKAQNLIGTVQPRTLGGRVVDMTQKPTLILRE